MEKLTDNRNNDFYSRKILRNLDFFLPWHYDVFYAFFEFVSEYLEWEIDDENKFIDFVKWVLKKLEMWEVKCEIKKYPLSIILWVKYYLTDEIIKSVHRKIIFLKKLKEESENVKNSIWEIENPEIWWKSNREVA